eukprot:TRINITY_DN74924_c0_g1_i1.p1 TRINITY_DN74924_c0_g1~~TRINITY_DN74924_c0_g1_i1.p1  ORF type:complete len:1008 (-),score=218.41 TRINITY_DN74924_c0_g1_i1:165-3188(-)
MAERPVEATASAKGGVPALNLTSGVPVASNDPFASQPPSPRSDDDAPPWQLQETSKDYWWHRTGEEPRLTVDPGDDAAATTEPDSPMARSVSRVRSNSPQDDWKKPGKKAGAKSKQGPKKKDTGSRERGRPKEDLYGDDDFGDLLQAAPVRSSSKSRSLPAPPKPEERRGGEYRSRRRGDSVSSEEGRRYRVEHSPSSSRQRDRSRDQAPARHAMQPSEEPQAGRRLGRQTSGSPALSPKEDDPYGDVVAWSDTLQSPRSPTEASMSSPRSPLSPPSRFPEASNLSSLQGSREPYMGSPTDSFFGDVSAGSPMSLAGNARGRGAVDRSRDSSLEAARRSASGSPKANAADGRSRLGARGLARQNSFPTPSEEDRALTNDELIKVRKLLLELTKENVVDIVMKSQVDGPRHGGAGSTFADFRKVLHMAQAANEKQGNMSLTERGNEHGCVMVFGLPRNATQREVHVLFSAHEGYEEDIILKHPVDRSSGAPDALVFFRTRDLAVEATNKVHGTRWDAADYPLVFEVADDSAVERERFTQGDRRLARTEDLARLAIGGPPRRSPERTMRSPERARSPSPDGHVAGARTSPHFGAMRASPSPGAISFNRAGSPSSAGSSPREEALGSGQRALQVTAEIFLNKALGGGKYRELEKAYNHARQHGVQSPEGAFSMQQVEEVLSQGSRRIATRRAMANMDRQRVALQRLVELLANYRPPALPPQELPGHLMAQHAKLLKVALQGVQICGCEGPDVEQAMELCQAIDLRQSIEQRIEECINHNLPSETLHAALEAANEVAADEQLLHRGTYVLAVRRRQETARQNMQTAIEGLGAGGRDLPPHLGRRGAVVSESAKSLQAAMEEARQAGLAEAELRAAHEALASELRQMGVRKLQLAMHRAPLMQDPGVLQQAIQEAARLGVGQELMDKAQAVLLEVPSGKQRNRPAKLDHPRWQDARKGSPAGYSPGDRDRRPSIGSSVSNMSHMGRRSPAGSVSGGSLPGSRRNSNAAVQAF